MSRPNLQQRAVADTTESGLPIRARSGSGTTHTLVERVIEMIGRGVRPEEILVSSFTEKSDEALVARVSDRLGRECVHANLKVRSLRMMDAVCVSVLGEFRERTRPKRSHLLRMDPTGEQGGRTGTLFQRCGLQAFCGWTF